ncbi:hypothetical protein [Acuticoccus sp.]|uniref:hypothetical protein n=1 Tax=Acuticoccus sp. TaxID=1904378 RepID=UPI003B525CF5
MTTFAPTLTLTLTVLGSVLLAGPLAAQEACAPGEFGAEADFRASGADAAANSVPNAADRTIVRATVRHQCHRVLDDGTFVPEGYAVRLYEGCADETCALALAFATPGRREGTYSLAYETEDGPQTARMRANRRGGLVLVRRGEGENTEGGRKRERLTLQRAD